MLEQVERSMLTLSLVTVGDGVAVIPVEALTTGPSAATDPLGLPVSVKISVAVPLPETLLSPWSMTALPEPSVNVSE